MVNFVITFQILLTLLWFPVIHAIREAEDKQDDTEIRGYFIHGYQNELRAQTHQTKSSIRNDVKNRMADMLFNLNGGIEIGKQYSEYQFNKDNQNHHYKAKYRFHSSLKQNYDDQSKRKPNKGHRAVRNVEDDTTLNTTNKGMTAFKNFGEPCRDEFSCKGRCVFAHRQGFSCQCDSDCELFKDCCADYRPYCNHSTSTIKLDQNLFCCVKTPTLSNFWAISKCPKEWKSNNISLKCERVPVQITGDNVRCHVPVIGENQTIFYNEYCAECNNARVLEYFDLEITSTIRLIPPRSSTAVEEAVTFALKYGENVTFSIAPRHNTPNANVRHCLPNLIRRFCPQKHSHEKQCNKKLCANFQNTSCGLCWSELPGNVYCEPRGSGGPPDYRFVTTFSFAIDFRNKLYSPLIILCPNIVQYKYNTRLKICRRAESVVNKKHIDKYRVVVWLKTQFPYANMKDKDFVSSLEISFHINTSQVSQVEIEKVPPDKFAVSFDLDLSIEQILALAKKSQALTLKTKEKILSSGNIGGFVPTKRVLPLKRLLFFSKTFNMTVSNVTYLVFRAISRQLACLKEQHFFPSENTLLPNRGYLINSTGETFTERQVVSIHIQMLTVCKKIIFSNCNQSQIVLKPAEYIKFSNLSIYLNRTNRTYGFGEYDIENGSIVACISLPHTLFPMLKTTNKGMTAFKYLGKPCRDEFSCEGRCVFVQWPGFSCQCDSDCELFKDCCADYRTYCNHSTSTIKLNQNLFCCVKMPTLSDKFWAISKCPKEWKSNNVSLKCESFPEQITGDNVRSHVPVIGENQTIFYNEYCAECNNARVLDYFELKITSTIRLIPPRSNATIEEAVKFALKYDPNVIFYTAPRHTDVRHCLPNLIRRFCPQRQPHEKQCNKKPCANFKNTSCGVCWSELPGDVYCEPRRYPWPGHRIVTTFSIAMDFRSKIYSSPIIFCPDLPEYKYDTLLKICRRAESVVNKKNIDKYRVVIWLETQSPHVNMKEKAFISSLDISFHINTSQVSQMEIEKVPPDKFAVSFDLDLSNEQISTLAKKSQPIILKTKEQILSSGNHGGFVPTKRVLPLKRLLFFSKTFNMTVSNVTCLVFRTISRQLSCPKEQKFSPGQYTWLQNRGYFIISTGEVFSEQQVVSEKYEKILTVCKKIIVSNCNESRIILKPEEYIKFSNLSIYLNRTNKTYDFGEYDIENGSIVACIFLPHTLFWKTNINQLILDYLTLVAFIISIINLSCVILTYVIFSELRHLPGKNILNLSTSLILAQILWLAAVGHPYTPTSCKVIAIVEHYLFLVSFFAMVIIAFHSRSVFASKQVSREVSRLKAAKMFLKYSAIVWGIPAIFALTCGLIDNQGVYAIYVDKQMQVCWFNNAKAQLYFFVLPVSFSLTFNIVFFVFTLIHISRQRAETSILATSNSALQPRKRMIWVYVKLSTLMGFSWLFGCLDILIHSTPVFSYLFVIFASLQGLYIAVAFVFNKRVFKLYRQIVRKKRTRRRKTNDNCNSTLPQYSNTRETKL